MARKLITYVIPIYNEEQVLPALEEALLKLFRKLPHYSVEVVMVNDGSKDRSAELLTELHKKDPRFTIVQFARNFGHQAAITAGLDFAQGDAVIIMDADLQDPPEVSLELIKQWEQGFDVVYAQRRQRAGESWFKKFTAHLFYRLLRSLADIDIPADTGDFRLLDRRAVEALRKFKEHNRFMRGLVSFIGFKQTAVLFDRAERFAGSTHYPMGKMLKLAFDGITSFSTIPLRLIWQAGLFIASLSLLGIGYALFMKFFFPQSTISGWTTIILCVLFLGGMQMIMLGILGLYIGRIYVEVQNRPLYIVRSVLNKTPFRGKEMSPRF